MSQLVLKVNKKQINPQSINYFTYEGKFNYYVEVEINGQVSETTSDILVQVYKKNDKKYTMSCNLNWFIEKDNFQNRINHNNKHFQVSALQYNSKVICKITPTEQGFFGECRLYYGPIKLNNKLYNNYQKIQKEDFLELDVKGVSLQNMTNFATIEVNKNQIITSDQNFQTVNDLKINNNLQIINSAQNPLQIKLCQRRSQLEILDFKTQSLQDRDLFILILNDKLQQKRNSNQSQNFGRQCEKQLTNQINDVSIVKRNTNQNNSISSFRSINRLIRGKNPLQKRVDQTNNSQRSLSQQPFQGQKNIRNISQFQNTQNQFSVEQDSIVNKYLTNQTFEQNQNKPSFGKMSFKQKQQMREVSPVQFQNKQPDKQQNYFQVTESFEKKKEEWFKHQNNIKQNRQISQERIANVELNKKNQNLYLQNQDYLQSIKRLQITNNGLKRELDFIKLQKQKNEEQESILKDQKETAMRNQYNILNDKYQDQKKQVLQLETKLEEIQKRLLNTQTSLMETENAKYLLQNQFREFKDNKQNEWDKMQLLQKQNTVYQNKIDDLLQQNQYKQKIENELKDKVDLVENLQDTIKKLKIQNDINNQEQKDYVKDLNYKDKKIQKLQQTNQDLYDELNLLRQDKQELIEELQEMKFLQKEQKEQIQNLTNFNEFEDKYLLEQKSNEMMKKKLQEKEDELINLENKFSILKLKKDQIQEELDEQKILNINDDTTKQNEYRKMFDEMKFKFQSLKREYNLLQQEKDILEENLKEKKDEVQNYKLIQIENEDMIENLSQNINLKKKIEIEENKNINQDFIIDEYQQKIQEQEQLYLNLQDNMSKLRQDIFYLREEKFEYLEKIQKLQQNLNIKEQDINELNQELNIKQIEQQNLQCKIDQQDLEIIQIKKDQKQNTKLNAYSQKKQGYSTRLDMEDILQQKEKQIEFLIQKNKQQQQKLNKEKIGYEQDNDLANNVLQKLKMQDSQINSMQFELNKKTQKIDNLLLILKSNKQNNNQQQNSQILKKIQKHAQKLEEENEFLKDQIQNINSQQKYGDSLNMLGNIEIEDVKEQLLRLLELYEEDLRYEYELLDIEDIVLKLKELIFDLKKAKNQLEEKEILLDETNKLLLDYNNEKYDDNSLLDTEIYYDQQLIFLQLNVRILNIPFNNIELFFICTISVRYILFFRQINKLYSKAFYYYYIICFFQFNSIDTL